jgi:hypothetical protein
VARIRTIKPDFFVSEDVSPLPLRARLTWIGLWTQCDDHGRTKDNVRLIKAALWALDEVTLADIEDDLARLHDSGRIVRYMADGKGFLAVVNWHVHQAVSKPTRARHPAPPVPVNPSDPGAPGYCRECALQAPGPLPENSGSPPGALPLGREGNGKEGSARETPPQQPSRIGLVAAMPPRKCPQHLNDPNPPACGACKDARKAADGVPTNVPVTPTCPMHPDQLTGSKACPRCASENSLPPTDFRSRVGA